MAAASATRAFLTSRAAAVADLSSSLKQQQQHHRHQFLIRPLLPARKRVSSAAVAVRCLISGVDGGGVSDDFLLFAGGKGGTRKSTFDREFSVISNMLKRIEPLDNSVISKGVSDSAKDSMKQTISTMLGLLPSDQFSVTVRVSKLPLHHIIVSSIITGYTLWNAEYRLSLMRNFDIPMDDVKRPDTSEVDGVLETTHKEGDVAGDADGLSENLGGMALTSLEDLSPEALSYIRQLEAELSMAKEELHARKQQNLHLEYIKKSNNDLLDYLRSLESDMVSELSRPSSPEVEEIVHQLAQNILQRFFKDDRAADGEEDSTMGSSTNYQNSGNEYCDSISTPRDYLAKLLFWCMLLGHHLRGLENRLHLSCVVGLL